MFCPAPRGKGPVYGQPTWASFRPPGPLGTSDARGPAPMAQPWPAVVQRGRPLAVAVEEKRSLSSAGLSSAPSSVSSMRSRVIRKNGLRPCSSTPCLQAHEGAPQFFEAPPLAKHFATQMYRPPSPPRSFSTTNLAPPQVPFSACPNTGLAPCLQSNEVGDVSFQEASPFTAQQPQQASHVPQTHPSSPQRCSSTPSSVRPQTPGSTCPSSGCAHDVPGAFDAPKRRPSETMQVFKVDKSSRSPSTQALDPRPFGANDVAKIPSRQCPQEALPAEAEELLRSLGQPCGPCGASSPKSETPNKAELRQCRAMLGRQAEQLRHQNGEIRRLRSFPACSQAASTLSMQDAQCEISCLRASIKRREAEVHLAQVELAYLNTLVAQKDLQLQKAEEQLVSSSPSEAPSRSLAKRIAKEELACAEAEAEHMLQPLAAAREGFRRDPLARQSSLDGDSSEAAPMLSASEIDTATAAGQRVLASLRRAREALERSPCLSPPRDLGGMSCSP
ncbi:unnamed protein product [Durusdinium trenchii]|uniref:Uncharacterized protein n=2 Tax=Durusdinium trenchii TaxID=1381693 RepID=A0ABP0LZ66_9DINO